MSDGRGPHECRGDLVARERHGELSSSDRIALGAHLDTCATCRMTREIRADFEAETAVELDDAVRIARMSAAARRWSQRRARPRVRGARRPRQWRRAVLGAAALLLLAGSASATAWWWRAETRAQLARAAAPARVAAPARLRVAALARRGGQPAPAREPVVVAEEPSAPPAVETEVRRPRLRARAVAVLAPKESAAALLRRADEARRRGSADEAVAVYRRLQTDFADSREAIVSTVPLGGLLLREGQSARAGEQFDRYLSAEPHGNLIPEALYGRGRAQAALGQREAERQTWRRLLDQSPGSAYDSHARRRLSELR